MTTEQKAQNTSTAIANIVRICEGRYIVPSRRVVGESYLVIRNAEGVLTCDCEGAYHGHSCWHVTAVAQAETRRAAAPLEPRSDAALDPAVIARRAAGMALITGGRR